MLMPLILITTWKTIPEFSGEQATLLSFNKEACFERYVNYKLYGKSYLQPGALKD